ncbi:WD repeat-containing protein 24 [Coelomomyces lativittatus]|nr:WD repeat-containing protein 24 [Coelomomyces lativittatus]
MKSIIRSPSAASTSPVEQSTYLTSGSLPIHLEPYLTSKTVGSIDDTSHKHNVLVVLNALSLSSDKDMVVVAGRELLKVFSLSEEKEIKEVLNLRLGCRWNQNFCFNDVKWCQLYAKGLIATAATNGSIILWNINKSGQKMERNINEHSRSVNRVSFHPSDPYLLSASQDGIMKLWDLRAKGPSKQTYEGKAESVRDIQFSPAHSHTFVSVFETGIVQKWDMRFPAAPEKRFTAHNGIALTVDHHPNGRYIATGGRDKQVKIWNLFEDTRKPQATVQTIAPVSRVIWRPLLDKFQVTVSSLQSDFRTHVFDLNRPCISIATFQMHSNIITGMAWMNSSQLWTCSKDKNLICSHIKSSYQLIKDLNPSAVSWHPSGQLCGVLQRSLSDLPNEPLEQSSSSNSMFSRKTPFKKPDKLFLAESLKLQYKPNQVTFCLDPHLFDVNKFTYLSRNYCVHAKSVSLGCQLNADVSHTIGAIDTQEVWLLIQSLVSTVPKSFSHRTHQLEFDPFQVHQVSILENIFESFADLCDVQFCCTLYMLLDEPLRNSLSINESRREQFNSVSELLHRFMIYDAPTAILKHCPIPSFSKKLQENTTIHLLCPSCSKPILNPFSGLPSCDRCFKLLNSCSLCHQIVEGQYSWCQGCGHGGHTKCLLSWFQKHHECCTGCGHTCFFL